MQTISIYAPVKEWQKRATLGAVFGARQSPNPAEALIMTETKRTKIRPELTFTLTHTMPL